MSPAAWGALRAIRLYQLLTSWRPTPCRYVPTCSHYGAEAIEVHGFVRGGWMTARRIGRCTPWASTNGWDPVPAGTSPPTPAPRPPTLATDEELRR